MKKKLEEEADAKIKEAEEKAAEEIRKVTDEKDEKIKEMTESLRQRATFIKSMTKEEYTDFVNEVCEHVLKSWSGYSKLLIEDVPEVIASIISSFRTNSVDDHGRCTAILCAGDVQGNKTPIIVLQIIVLDYIRYSKTVLDQPKVILMEDTQSNRNLMKPKLQRLLKQYTHRDIQVAIASDPVMQKNHSSVIVYARTAAQITKATPKEEYNQELDQLLSDECTSYYVILDEADATIGSCEGLQQYEQAIENLLDHHSIRGVSFISATLQHIFGVILNTHVKKNPRIRLKIGSIRAFYPCSHPERKNYIGFKDASKFEGKYLQDQNADGTIDSQTDRGVNNTNAIFDRMVAEVNNRPFACMMVRMCTGVRQNTRSVSMIDLALQIEKNLLKLNGHTVKDAFQIVVTCSSTVFEGHIGVRAFGPNVAQFMQRFTAGAEVQTNKEGFVELQQLLPILVDIEEKATLANPRYVRTITKLQNGNWRSLNIAQLSLLMYHIRNLFPGIPLYVIGSVALGRSLSVVSVDPFTDGTDKPRVMNCITHVALNVREDGKGNVSKNHSDIVQTFLRFATTLKPFFHEVHGFLEIPVLTQKEVWKNVKSNHKFNEWLFEKHKELEQLLREIRKRADRAYKNDEGRVEEKITEQQIIESFSLQLDPGLRCFFEGKNWGHRLAKGVNHTTAQVLLQDEKNTLVAKYGTGSSQVREIDEEIEDADACGYIKKSAKRIKVSKKKTKTTGPQPWETIIPADNPLRTNVGYRPIVERIANGKALGRAPVKKLVLTHPQSLQTLSMQEVDNWLRECKEHCDQQGLGVYANFTANSETHAVLQNLKKLLAHPTV